MGSNSNISTCLAQVRVKLLDLNCERQSNNSQPSGRHGRPSNCGLDLKCKRGWRGPMKLRVLLIVFLTFCFGGCAHYEAVSSAQRLFVNTPASFSYDKDISTIGGSELRNWMSENKIRVDSLPSQVQAQLNRRGTKAILLRRFAPSSTVNGFWNFDHQVDAVWMPIPCEPGEACSFSSYILTPVSDCTVKNEICACHNGACVCTEWCGAANPCPSACASSGLAAPCL